MSYINDYSIKAIAEQRQRDLWAQAADHRLAAIVRGNHPTWWQRLVANWRRTAPRPAGGSIGRRLSAQSHEYAGQQPHQPTSLRTKPQMRQPAGRVSRTAVAR
jgi:hypothetical protein